eukprot:1863666-Amphidinium_carterae.1
MDGDVSVHGQTLAANSTNDKFTGNINKSMKFEVGYELGGVAPCNCSQGLAELWPMCAETAIKRVEP